MTRNFEDTETKIVNGLLTREQRKLITLYDLPTHLSKTVAVLVIARRHPKALTVDHPQRAGWPMLACEFFMRRRGGAVQLSKSALNAEAEKCEQIAMHVAKESENREFVSRLPQPLPARALPDNPEVRREGVPVGYSTCAGYFTGGE